MSIVLSHLAEHERPRERLAALGVGALSERELLALILRSGRPGESAVDLAGVLLAQFNGLVGLARALPEELSSVPGVGAAKAAAIVGALGLGARVARSPELRTLNSCADVAGVAEAHLTGLRRERVIVLVCDSANRVIQVTAVSEGSIDQALFPVREILNAALRVDGRGFALAHNHPSGGAVPSESDCRATAAVMAGARAVGLRMLGHVVLGSDSWAEVRPTGRLGS